MMTIFQHVKRLVETREEEKDLTDLIDLTMNQTMSENRTECLNIIKHVFSQNF
jgi:hypothetical protein